MFDPTAYGPLVAQLLTDPRLPDLGPGRPNLAARPLLQSLTIECLFDGLPVRDVDMARACLAALWLHHDFPDESHAISQEIATPTGSYWHGILHRREPDAGNAKYWFRRVGRHPVFADLGADWDPFAFVDECERHRGTGTEAETRLRQEQLREWQALFDWCWRRAVEQG